MAEQKNWFRDNWNDLLKPIVVLLCICLVIPAALAVTNRVTAPKIAELAEQEKNESMQVLFRDAEKFNEKTAGDATYYEALKGDECCGYIFTTSAKGYGGAVSVMTAVLPEGTVKAVKILSVADETPGLGQNAAKENFYGQFEGLSASEKVALNKQNADAKKNEITPVTGATITSTAVKNAVNEALSLFGKITEGGADDE